MLFAVVAQSAIRSKNDSRPVRSIRGSKMPAPESLIVAQGRSVVPQSNSVGAAHRANAHGPHNRSSATPRRRDSRPACRRSPLLTTVRSPAGNTAMFPYDSPADGDSTSRARSRRPIQSAVQPVRRQSQCRGIGSPSAVCPAMPTPGGPVKHNVTQRTPPPHPWTTRPSCRALPGRSARSHPKATGGWSDAGTARGAGHRQCNTSRGIGTGEAP